MGPPILMPPLLGRSGAASSAWAASAGLAPVTCLAKGVFSGATHFCDSYSGAGTDSCLGISNHPAATNTVTPSNHFMSYLPDIHFAMRRCSLPDETGSKSD